MGTARFALLTGFFLAQFTATPQTVPGGFDNAQMMAGFSEPVGVTFDDNGRWYVWEKRGRVWIVENGVRLPDPLIDISPEVGNWRDHGCLGFALDPDFLSNGYIYLMYTVDRHYLMNFGTPAYDAAANQYYAATITRITRYTAVGPNFTAVNPASRFILFGETPSTGSAVLHESHSQGHLVFGTDGTLLAATGDGASYLGSDIGNNAATYHTQALADGIIRPAENVGVFRSQMVNSFNGKLLRLDPATGDGVPSNPFYDPAEPRSAKSRMWALGLRNPYRMVLRPGTGSTDPSAADPGTLHIGDVGWATWEELHVCSEPAMNFGWPMFEGMGPSNYMNQVVTNTEAPNPLFGNVGCTQQYFTFQDLLKQETLNHSNLYPNPCNSGVQIPDNVPHFMHARPAIDWRHGNQSRCGAFSGNTAVTFDLDAPGSPVPGPRFGGVASVAGTWITGAGWPAGYQNVYMHADYGAGWIKRFAFNAQDAPTTVSNFGSALGAVVFLTEGPDGALWYIKYETNSIWRIAPIGINNLPPVASATQSVVYGPGPLVVDFDASSSSDPEGQALTYAWDLGDGSSDTGPVIQHSFPLGDGSPMAYWVTLTVTDPEGATDQNVLLVSVNNTPPVPVITGFPDGHLYPVGVDTTYALAAEVTDLEHGPGEIAYEWRTIFHHNDHTHPESPTNSPTGSTVISGEGCGSETFYYEVQLTVTDAAGLSGTATHWLYPRCSSLAPTAVIITDVDHGPAPLTVLLYGGASMDNGAVVSWDWDLGDGTSDTGESIMKTFTETGDHFVTLTVTDDDGLTHTATKVITVLSEDPPQCVGPLGGILRELWTDIPGLTVNDLTSSANYPDLPDASSVVGSFFGGSGLGDNYGTRFRGYIVAPETGEYIFTAVSDDHSTVYLSPNADPQYKQPICGVPGWANQGQFDKYPEQVSLPVQLVAGRYYYVEMLHKEAEGLDHVALWWQTPSNSTHVIIPGVVLAPWQDCLPGLTVRTNLQGAFDASTNLMRDDLRTAALIPAQEPFTGLGFVHAGDGGGETIGTGLLDVSGKNAIVDWVLVELRDPISPATVLETQSALVQRDGDVIGTDGYTRLLFDVAPGDYYVAVRHRNSLGVMTNFPFTVDAGGDLLDLTTPSSGTYGTNARAILAPGRMGLWSGNVNLDDKLKYTGSSNDRDPIIVAIGGVVPTNTVDGYLNEDVNLDGQVKYTGFSNDRDPILMNIGGTVPTNTRTEQLP